MISDEERRKFAENLRYIAQHPPEWATSACAIAEVFDANYPLWKDSGELFDMLADLIDRSTCENGGRLNERTFLCSACGYEAHTYSDSDCNPHDFSYCPECGSEVVS